jgi:hypothetical protein
MSQGETSKHNYIKHKLNSYEYIIEYAENLDKAKIIVIKQIFEKYYKKYIKNKSKSKSLCVGEMWNDVYSFDLFISTFGKNKSYKEYRLYTANDNYIYNDFNYDLGRIFLFLLKQSLTTLKKINNSLKHLEIDSTTDAIITKEIKEYKVKNFLVGSTNLVLLKYIKLLNPDKVTSIKNILAVLKHKYELYTEVELYAGVSNRSLYKLMTTEYHFSTSKFVTQYSSQTNINFDSILLALFSMTEKQLLEILEHVKSGLLDMKERIKLSKFTKI